MKSIKARIIRLIVANILIIILMVTFFLNQATVNRVIADLVIIAAIILILVLFVLLIREYGRYKSAKLILENEIMHIQVAKIEDKTIKTNKDILLEDSIDARISCFGIMLDSRIIKYNIDGIVLRSIEIGKESISFVYGANGKDKALRILHGQIDRQKMQDFIKRISYETGVSPLFK